jgi:hypothetical protein
MHKSPGVTGKWSIAWARASFLRLLHLDLEKGGAHLSVQLEQPVHKQVNLSKKSLAVVRVERDKGTRIAFK